MTRIKKSLISIVYEKCTKWQKYDAVRRVAHYLYRFQHPHIIGIFQELVASTRHYSNFAICLPSSWIATKIFVSIIDGNSRFVYAASVAAERVPILIGSLCDKTKAFEWLIQSISNTKGIQIFLDSVDTIELRFSIWNGWLKSIAAQMILFFICITNSIEIKLPQTLSILRILIVCYYERNVITKNRMWDHRIIIYWLVIEWATGISKIAIEWIYQTIKHHWNSDIRFFWSALAIKNKYQIVTVWNSI